MARHRRKQGTFTEQVQDPGKDLFAYLFLLIMIFTFMVLLTTEERRDALAGQTAPDNQPTSSQPSLTVVEQSQMGRLEKDHGEIVLKFGDVVYSPVTDIRRLVDDGRIAHLPDVGGGEKRVLYLQEDKNNPVMLGEYLSTFHVMGKHGISVAFAERVK